MLVKAAFMALNASNAALKSEKGGDTTPLFSITFSDVHAPVSFLFFPIFKSFIRGAAILE